MRYFFPIHLDGGNRGCEAIARSSAILLGEIPQNVFGYCRDVALDTRLGLSKYLTLVPVRRESYVFDKILGALNRLIHTRKTKEWRELYPYKSFLRLATCNDIVISTGGDMLCYDDNEVVYTNNWLHGHGVKTVLWGCSMGAENQTPEKLKTLHNFSLIYARESLSYDYFKSLGIKNLCMLPDPAFILPAEEFVLPSFFESGDIIGINISNYVASLTSFDSNFGHEIIRMIDYIIRKTNYHIILIPHVTWCDSKVNQDDRQMAQMVFNYFGQTERMSVLDINPLNYCKIRYAISRCKMFIGAHTHAVISAYSMCVPTIALGYSIKSRGIAKDLGLDERLVVNSKSFHEGDLLDSFVYLMENETQIRQHLHTIMPGYTKKTYSIKDILKTL